MQNPYEELFQKKKEDNIQAVHGFMECYVCYKSVDMGTYYVKEKMLTWVCPDGHENSIAGYEYE